MRIKTYIRLLVCLLALSLAACGNRQGMSPSSDGDTLALKYAERISIVQYDDYTVVKLQNPWDTLKTLHTYVLVDRDRELPPHLPVGTIVHTPLQKAVVFTSVHSSLADVLGKGSSIGGVCDLKYIQLPFIQEGVAKGTVMDCGDAMNPDIEKIIDLHPDAIMLSPFNNSGGYGRVEELDIPIVECADYMETSALGRAEWMKFYGLLFGASDEAEQLFEEVSGNYERMKALAAQAATHPKVVVDLKMGSTWYVPGGRSTQGRLLVDAGADYPFADTDDSGSIPLSVEMVMDRCADADVWMFKASVETEVTLRYLASDYEGYTHLKAYKDGSVYGCNTTEVAFYEEAPYRPDYLLGDMIQIFHPEIEGLGGLRYYSKIEN